jgi:hypothetical protein
MTGLVSIALHLCPSDVNLDCYQKKLKVLLVLDLLFKHEEKDVIGGRVGMAGDFH